MGLGHLVIVDQEVVLLDEDCLRRVDQVVVVFVLEEAAVVAVQEVNRLEEEVLDLGDETVVAGEVHLGLQGGLVDSFGYRFLLTAEGRCGGYHYFGAAVLVVCIEDL